MSFLPGYGCLLLPLNLNSYALKIRRLTGGMNALNPESWTAFCSVFRDRGGGDCAAGFPRVAGVPARKGR